MEGDLQNDRSPMAGLLPRTLCALFQALRIGGTEFTVRVTHIELYNEEISDLLSESNENNNLRIFETQEAKGHACVFGAEDVLVQNETEAIRLLQESQKRKRVSETLLNKHSRYKHVHTHAVSMQSLKPFDKAFLQSRRNLVIDDS
jgi:kinesin family protein 11